MSVCCNKWNIEHLQTSCNKIFCPRIVPACNLMRLLKHRKGPAYWTQFKWDNGIMIEWLYANHLALEEIIKEVRTTPSLEEKSCLCAKPLVFPPWGRGPGELNIVKRKKNSHGGLEVFTLYLSVVLCRKQQGNWNTLSLNTKYPFT